MARIKEFEFKNVRSYGNKITKIPFDMESGLVLIQGKNGFGKTSICEALEFAIYGKSSRVQAKNLPNWFNSSMYTSVLFDTDDNREVRVSRGIGPDFYNLEINGSKNENLSSKPRLDKLIEDELFAIPFEVFSNNILLSIHDFKSFVNMKTADKRKIIDKIFDTDIFNTMLKTVKDELKTCKEELSEIKNNIDAKTEVYESTMKRIEELKSAISDSNEYEISSLKEQLSEIKSSIDKYEKNLWKINDDITALNSEKSELDNKILKRKQDILNEYSRSIESANYEYSSKTASKKNEIDAVASKEKQSVNDAFNENVSRLESPDNANTNEIDGKILENKNSLLSIIDELSSELNQKLDSEKKLYESSVLNAETDNKRVIDKIIDENNEINNKITLLNTSIKQIESIKLDTVALLKSIDEKIDLYNNHKCPVCGTDLDNDEFHVHRKNDLIEEKNKNIEYLSLVESKLEEANNNLSSANNTYSDNIDLINSYKTKASDYIHSIEIKYSSTINELKNEYSSKINDIKEQYSKIIGELEYEKNNIISVAKNKYDKQYNVLLEIKNSEIDKINKKYSLEYELFESECTSEKNNKIISAEKLKNTESESVQNDENSIMSKYLSDKNELSSKMSDITSSLEYYKSERNSIEQKLSDMNVESSRSTLEELISMSKTMEGEISDLNLRYDEKKEYFEIRDDVEFLIGDDGLKKMIMRNILPAFNETIDQITTLFDFKYRFMFDDDFNVHMSYCGNPVPISTSRGEEKIMDIIVLLSTLQLIMMKHPTLNMLFLDEIFSNLDVENVAKAVSILKDYAKKYNLTLFVMSHTTVPQEMFDEIINVTNDGMFSDIEIIK